MRESFSLVVFVRFKKKKEFKIRLCVAHAVSIRYICTVQFRIYIFFNNPRKKKDESKAQISLQQPYLQVSSVSEFVTSQCAAFLINEER